MLIAVGGVLWFQRMEPDPPQAPPELSRTPGVRLFYRYECGRCHTVERLPECRGTMGPKLDGIGKRASVEYLRDSLRQPQKDVVEGYLKAMPVYDLQPAEMDELVGYLRTL